MKTGKFFTGILLMTTLLSCSQAHESSTEVAMSALDLKLENPKEETPPSNYISSSAAVENPQDSVHKFIRTANLKFKVKDVILSTYDIENIIGQQSGFVTSTKLESTVDNVTNTSISDDSSLVSTYYTVANTMELRVPSVKLDTTLKEIARNIDFLDYRIIQAQDVALQILTNELTQKRIAKNENRLTSAIDNRGKKLDETASAEDLLLNKQEQADNAKIANLSLSEQISFSTITLSIYQKQSVKRELVSNEKNITAYKPALRDQLLESLQQGLDILVSIVVFVAKLWAIILLGILAYLIYRLYKTMKQRNKNNLL